MLPSNYCYYKSNYEYQCSEDVYVDLPETISNYVYELQWQALLLILLLFFFLNWDTSLSFFVRALYHFGIILGGYTLFQHISSADLIAIKL